MVRADIPEARNLTHAGYHGTGIGPQCLMALLYTTTANPGPKCIVRGQEPFTKGLQIPVLTNGLKMILEKSLRCQVGLEGLFLPIMLFFYSQSLHL